ncbi:MAG: hypothetical protein HYY03_02055 [Chloroflexi bacterium]|nr:hypothetical protein [Chloroflexota bacterium]
MRSSVNHSICSIRGLAIAVAMTATALLLLACSGSQAEQGPQGSEAPSATGPAATAAASNTPIPRRTPGGSVQALDDKSPGLVAWYTKVEVSEGALTIADTRMEAEEVYFEVRALGEEEHKIEVARWDGEPGALPVDPVTNKVIAQSQLVASLEPLAGGNSDIFEIEPIAPGKYVIYCNKPGHYQRGEYAGFEVVAPPPDAAR